MKEEQEAPEPQEKRAAAAGLYKEAFTRLMNNDLEAVPELQAEAITQLQEAESTEGGSRK
jgi:hypothetical protein